jgi:hypothetical protein
MLSQKSPIPSPPLPYPLIPIFFGPGVPLYWGIYSLLVQWASLSRDGRLSHLLIHMQLESRAPGYWLVHNVVPPIGLQIPLVPWVLSLAPPLWGVVRFLKSYNGMWLWQNDRDSLEKNTGDWLARVKSLSLWFAVYWLWVTVSLYYSVTILEYLL